MAEPAMMFKERKITFVAKLKRSIYLGKFYGVTDADVELIGDLVTKFLSIEVVLSELHRDRIIDYSGLGARQ
jgi:hypothetical protein